MDNSDDNSFRSAGLGEAGHRPDTASHFTAGGTAFSGGFAHPSLFGANAKEWNWGDFGADLRGSFNDSTRHYGALEGRKGEWPQVFRHNSGGQGRPELQMILSLRMASWI